jgi:hypothetical protein
MGGGREIERERQRERERERERDKERERAIPKMKNTTTEIKNSIQLTGEATWYAQQKD